MLGIAIQFSHLLSQLSSYLHLLKFCLSFEEGTHVAWIAGQICYMRIETLNFLFLIYVYVCVAVYGPKEVREVSAP